MAGNSKIRPNEQAKPASAIEAVPVPAPASKELSSDPAAIRRLFELGEFPYETAMPTGLYEKHMLELQRELLKAQHWVQETGQRVVMLFEGRDAAGKGGVPSSVTWST